MTELDTQSIVGATLTGFYFASTRVLHLKFTQCQSERVLAKPDLISAQIWLVMPKRVVFRMVRQKPSLEKVTIEKLPKGFISTWSFGQEEMILAECKSVSHVFLPVVTD
jgi:hypothetical protein